MELFTPEVGLIFWMLIPFLIIFFILAKFAWPAIIKGVNARAQFIDDSIQSAKEANEKLAGIQQEGEAILEKARNEQLRILNETSKMREQLIEEAKKQAKVESDKIMDATRVSIQREKDDILRQVRTEIATISIDIAEKILRKNLDDSKEQQDMIDKLLKEVNNTGKN